MISVQEAKKLLTENLIQGKTIFLPLHSCIGLTLAEDLPAPYDIPFFDNSAMDGYAIKWQAGNNSRRLRPELKVKAGELAALELQENEAIRIFTGAPVPKGADTIIPQEWVSVAGEAFSFEIDRFEQGIHVRSKGAQNKAGDLIAVKGSKITPGMIGLLASIGLDSVPVYQPPSIGIILTGDELEEVGTALSFGKVYNANGPVLRSYCQQLGIQHVEMEKVTDDPEKLQGVIDDYLYRFDIVILSGGISVGDYDYVKAGLEKAGVKELLYKIQQKPGKPLFVGQKERQWVFALPGNPASTLTCFNQYVKPCIQAWLGQHAVFEPNGKFPLAQEFRKKAGLSFFLKAKLEDNKVYILPGQESFNLISYGTANCIAEIDAADEQLDAGAPVSIYFW